MPDPKKEAKQYFSFVYAALIIITVAVAAFIYSLITTDPVELEEILIEQNENDTTMITPGSTSTPDGPPSVEAPTFPPPSE